MTAKPAPIYDRVAFIGLGLIASSMALAIRQFGLAREITGHAKSAETRATALEIGLCDKVFDTAAQAVDGADLVVLCVPVGAMGEIAAEIAPRLKAGACRVRHRLFSRCFPLVSAWRRSRGTRHQKTVSICGDSRPARAATWPGTMVSPGGLSAVFYVPRNIFMKDDNSSQAYWKATLALLTRILIIWFVVSFGAGILFADLLNNIKLGGYPLGFWFAQQGSIYIFIALIFYYAKKMGEIDRKFDVHED